MIKNEIEKYLEKLKGEGVAFSGYEVKRQKLPRKLKKKYKKEGKFCFDVKLYQNIKKAEIEVKYE